MSPALTHPIQWKPYVAWLVDEFGSLTSAADRLAAHRNYAESVETIERALRRLRNHRGAGGRWGERCIRQFGLPDVVQNRLRFIAHYHSRFNDLPTPVGWDLVRGWDCNPLMQTDLSATVRLAQASLYLRGRNPVAADRALEQVRPMLERLPLDVRVEWLLVKSFAVSRSDPDASNEFLAQAVTHLEGRPHPSGHWDCLHARAIDQRAYRYTRQLQPPDLASAEELYRQIDSLEPFARVRRHNGLGWCAHRRGANEEAREHASISVEIAGDAGSLRLRAMALRLQAVVLGEEGLASRTRSEAIARRLQDELLLHRFR